MQERSGRAMLSLSCVLSGKARQLSLSLMLMLAHAVTACASLPPPGPRQPSQALAEPLATALGKRVAAVQPNPVLSGFRVVTNGADAYAVLTSLADQAQRTLDLQYYLVHNDPSTRALLQHVQSAADRGVRVRLLIDDLHTSDLDEALRRLTEHPRIEVRVYNPLPAGRFSTFTKVVSSLTDLQRINHRMHNKMFVADNALAFTGGRNLGDEYFLFSDKANFVDMDLLVAGPAVQQLSRSFDGYWNSTLAYPVQVLVPNAPPPEAPASAALDAPQPVAPQVSSDATIVAREITPGAPMRLQWANARLLADQPSKVSQGQAAGPDQLMFDDVAALLRSAQREVLVISPYLVPGKPGMAIFEDLRKRGVRVRLLTCGLASTDAPVVHIGYSRYRPRMLSRGIELYELKPQIEGGQRRLGSFGQSQARLHAKALVVDGRYLVVGSMNLDPRSIELNTEIGLLINSPALAADVARLFDDVVQHNTYRVILADNGALQWVDSATNGGGPVREFDDEPQSSPLLRLTLKMLAPFAPEEML